ncbi:hypothetical protein BC938DRAFT_472316 [Jimgerdemannia flammicorona]|uniref:Zinc/iron permease n=1 Tax=Jimgerdemannia flammicorona TaxID=994334 RepID=A0A433Q6C4_9FUNG|nr:hypothetical protein BC938DRAFT_472316 [Jimgerdemannia flammicorona]
MDSLLWLLLLSISMLIGSFVAGSIPLAFKLSEERLRLISALGVGLLVGTALIVIIPEGIETLYSVPEVAETLAASQDFTIHKRTPLEPPDINRRADMGMEYYVWGEPDRRRIDEPASGTLRERQIEDLMESESPESGHVSTNDLSDLDDDARDSRDSRDSHGHEESTHQYIGLALIMGFSLMFLIDQFSSLHMHASSQHHRQVSVPDFTELDAMLDEPQPATNTNTTDPPSSASPPQDTIESVSSPPSSPTRRAFRSIQPPPSRTRLSPTVGLVVHAAADGIALGASASHPNLSFIVFLAIMLHKAPSAFGLTTVLLREGYNRRQIRRHLATFSFAAPSGALVTYLLLAQTGVMDPTNMQWWTGMLLLFSGGTFLYVAMHVLEEVQGHGHEGPGGSGHGHKHGEKVNGMAEGGAAADGSAGEKGKMSYADLACVTVGMFLPLLLNVEHGH